VIVSKKRSAVLELLVLFKLTIQLQNCPYFVPSKSSQGAQNITTGIHCHGISAVQRSGHRGSQKSWEMLQYLRAFATDEGLTFTYANTTATVCSHE
jgi:hypothetical protein